jgi:site-specific recombinase XerD
MSVRPHPQQHLPDHAGKWIIDYKKPNGKRAQEIFVGTEAEAIAIEQSLRIRSRTASFRVFPSLIEVAPLFVDHYQLDHQPAGAERLAWSLKKILPFFGKYQFQSITNPLVEQYKRQRLADGVKHTTINKELAALSSFCRWAEDSGYCEHIKIRRFPNKLTRAPLPDVPSRKEIIKLLRSISRKKRPVFCSMYYLGLRSQEAKGLQLSAVRWAQGVVVIVGKGNKQRIVPINRKAAVYLRNSVPFYSPQDMREILEWACKRAGIKRKINPHLFRHAFGCHMTAAGVGIRALQEIMGHSTVQVTEIYSQVVAETLIKEMGKF